MIPSRTSRSSSRRSSILKPPKPRHPLQNLNFNSSSNENSPATTTKIKRRVSFAEKKHVKEFCNSVEQGTVWDNTYEEHDLSNLKPLCNSNQEECEVEHACPEQVSDSNQGNEVHFVCNEVTEKDVSVKDRIAYDTSIVGNADYREEMRQEDEPISPAELPLIVNRVSKSIIVYEDEDDILHAKVLQLSKSEAINLNYNKLDATSVDDACMEITEGICNNIYANKNNIENNEAEEVLKDVSMEFTQAILPSLNVQTLQNDVYDQNKSMDLTSAVPSIKKPSDINNIETFPCFVEDRTKKLDMSMEMTGVVSNISCNFQRNSEKSVSNDNRDIIFHDTSMETTKAVRTNVQRSSDRLVQLQETPTNRYDMVCLGEKSKVLDMSMEMTTPVPINVHSVTKMQGEKSKLLDMSMEMTTPVPINVHSVTKIQGEKSRLLDMSMEMTRPVPNNLHSLTKMQGEKSRLLDTSMEMTTPVPINVHSVTKMQGEKSRLLDTSMEMTRPVPNNLHSLTKMLGEKSRLLDTFMEMTTPVPINVHSVTKMQGEKSRLLDTSMEMTTPVPINVHSVTKMQGEKSRLLDTSMEMTRPVPNNLHSLTKMQGEKSRLLDTSMEMTTPVPINVHSVTKMQGEKSKLLDTSMEMTTPVPINVYSVTKIQGEKSRPLDMSMEMTTPVPINVHAPTKNQREKSKLLDMSMEMTTPVPINVHTATTIQDRGASDCTITEKRYKKLRYNTDIYLTAETVNKTRTFSDEDMECTGVVAVPPEVYQDNLEQSVQDMSYTKPITPGSVLDNCSNEKADRTTIFHNNSMMMTNVISTFRTNEHNRESGRTMVFQNTSMDITEALTAPRSHSEIDVLVDNEKVRQSILPENIEKENLSKYSLTQTEIAPEKISMKINSPLSKSTTAPDKENSTLNNISENIGNRAAEKSVPIETQNSINTKTSMALHETIQLDTCASAFKESNTDTACGTISSMNIEYHKNDCLQNTVSHSRRTYTIQALNNDHTFPTNGDEDDNTSPEGNDKNDIFFSNNLEELESIKPPSFLCLEDSEADISMNVTGNQEIVREINYLQEESNCRDRNFAQTDEEKLLEEDIRKAQTFLLKRASVNADPDVSQFEQENQRHLNKIEKLNLLEASHINTDLQVLENSNLKNQSMECSLRNIRDTDADRGKTENSDKVIDTDMMVENDGSYLEMNTSSVEESSSVELTRFATLITELKVRSKSDNIIWEVYHENIEKNLFIIGFMSCSLLLVIYLHDPCEVTGDQCLKEIRMISRLADDADPLICMVHRLILEKLDPEMLLNSYKNYENIFPMLEHASKEVKLAMDFMFELKRLNNVNLMEISRDSISFVMRSKRNDIILKITMDIKPFDKIESQNISVHCLLGSVREEDIKKLIINIKRDHKFLRRYMNDIKDYMYLMKEAGMI